MVLYNQVKEAESKKEVDPVSEKEKKIMETFSRVIPTLTDAEKDQLLAFGEGMALMSGRQAQAGA